MVKADLAAHLSESVLSYARKDVPLLRPDMTIESALAHIRTGGVGERIIYFYVADAADKLLGVVPTRRLLINPLDRPLSEVMSPRVVSIPGTATLLDACEMFVLYKYLAFPVVDEDKKICGVVDISLFATEVFEMSEGESHDDIFEAIGVHVEQLRNASALTAFRHRFPWLLGTIGSGTICAFLAGAFEGTLSQALTVAFFLPLVLGLNESVAMQSMSLSLQALHGIRPDFALLSRTLRRELATSFLLALAASAIAAAIVTVWRKSVPTAVVLGSSILASVVLAGILGFVAPMLLRLGKRDPKIAAGPLTLAIVDIAALLIYFTLAMLTLR